MQLEDNSTKRVMVDSLNPSIEWHKQLLGRRVNWFPVLNGDPA